ncbi:hypothetical protein J6590_025555 [Homalodisca vitripennis]|nr:hypothetical protein J6590_025555 [Homalodisca vitripennis]
MTGSPDRRRCIPPATTRELRTPKIWKAPKAESSLRPKDARGHALLETGAWQRP